MNTIRPDFPILTAKIHEKPLIYLDNAATMQMPLQVQNRIKQFYEEDNSNIHRGVHTLSEKSTFLYESVRDTVRDFLHGQHDDAIIFTPGTTDAINMTAQMLSRFLKPGDEIITTQMEHHANFIPWYELCKNLGLTLRILQVDSKGQLDLNHLETLVNEKTKIAAFTELSNVTGIEAPVREIISYIRSHSNAYILLDGAQGVVHSLKKMSEVDCDFYCFSGHKLGAPTGTGVLYVKEAVFKTLKPARFGGGTVTKVSSSGIQFVDGPAAFEPGTPNYAGVIGLGEALTYWKHYYEKYSQENCEDSLISLLEQGLCQIDGVRILGETEHRKGCISFVIDHVHPYDFCKFMDLYGIAARSGHLCAMPYLEALHTDHAIRFSVAPYNTLEEIHTVLEQSRKVIEMLKRIQK